MNLVWMPLMIAWILKIVLVRYGTFKLLRKTIPFFLGLILGQFVVGSILNIISIALGLPSYMFWQ
jgi:cation transporter-like permease